MQPNDAQQQDLFRLDWLPLTEAARLCGLSEQWLADELLGGQLKGIEVRVTQNGNDPGMEIWWPSLGLWLLRYREQNVSALAVLKNGRSR